ncbi:Uncharacterised protein [Enterobacter cloacae]|uniref:Uncharacterized protein n=1 Tax=Enterobacter cloacae TaxID=550 RepID=A0A377M0X5_ENTCL|nr:Uncharacterised protein [Enterobacter cloacae]
MTGGRIITNAARHSTLNYQTPSEFCSGLGERVILRMKIPTFTN